MKLRANQATHSYYFKVPVVIVVTEKNIRLMILSNTAELAVHGCVNSRARSVYLDATVITTNLKYHHAS